MFRVTVYPIVVCGVGEQIWDNPGGFDFGVPKLERLWWVEGDVSALEIPGNEWHWKLLIVMPDFITAEIVFRCST